MIEKKKKRSTKELYRMCVRKLDPDVVYFIQVMASRYRLTYAEVIEAVFFGSIKGIHPFYAEDISADFLRLRFGGGRRI